MKVKKIKTITVYKTCNYCNGKGVFNKGVSKSEWQALDWLGFGEEVCNACGGSGKIEKTVIQ